MLENRDLAHWEKCSEFMKWLIIKEAGKYSTPITADLVDEIKQNAMLSVVIHLPHFRFESKLTTWLIPIARTRTIDALRSHTRNLRTNTPMNNLMEDEESEVVAYEYEMPKILEEEYLRSEELLEVVAEISAYFDSHAKSERNRKIAKMVLLDGRTLENAAREVRVSPAVASYVIRTLQRHLQEKFKSALHDAKITPQRLINISIPKKQHFV